MLKAVLSFQICPMCIRCPRKNHKSRTYMLTFHNHFPICSPFELPPQHQKETSASLSQKIELAMASTGASVSVTVIEIGQPSVSISSETTTSPSTTTAYCPGNPVCGGISGQLGRNLDDFSVFFADYVLMRGICNCRFPQSFQLWCSKRFLTEMKSTNSQDQRFAPRQCVVAVNDSRSWRCECSETYDGEACEIRTCPRCQNNGTCVSGTQSPQWPAEFAAVIFLFFHG